MGLSTTDLVDIHAAVGPPTELIERRRATYQLAVRLASEGEPTGDLDTAVVDNPMLRGHLADVVAGTARLDPARITSLESMVTDIGRWDQAGMAIRAASSTSSSECLSAAVSRVGAALVRNGADDLTDVVLDERSPQFGAAAEVLRTGIGLALDVAPDLIGDLLPHVALFALLDKRQAGQLGSASAREFPGLVLMPEPETTLEAAEAVIHEAAHQKFFDLAIVGSIFNEGYHDAPQFIPPWAATATEPWPFEQTVAAYHTYACLAAFRATLDDKSIADRIHSFSLLPHARSRAGVLGDWIAERRQYLGRDGRVFIGRLSGRQIPSTSAGMTRRDEILTTWTDPSVPLASRRCGAWVLFMRWSSPAEIAWIPSAQLEDARKFPVADQR